MRRVKLWCKTLRKKFYIVPYKKKGSKVTKHCKQQKQVYTNNAKCVLYPITGKVDATSKR